MTYIKLPVSVKAITMPDEYGDYDIYVNRNLCFNQQDRAIKHELEHIQNGDFEKFVDVSLLEKEIKIKLG